MKISAILFLAFSAGVFAQAQYIPKFDVQGHRGARGLRPENTIPAFLLALDSGVNTLEMDLAVTRDGQLVVSHEPWLSSEICLDAAGNPILKKDERKFNIYQMTYPEVSACDCGTKVNERFPQQVKMKTSKPLLRDVLIAVEDHVKNFSSYEVDYNIEIKTVPGMDNKFHPKPDVFSDKVYELLDEYVPLERVVIQSFDFRVLKYWHTKYPDVRLAALVENTKSAEQNLDDLGFLPSVYSPDFNLLSREIVGALHEKKIRVIPWTVNEEKDMLVLKGMGVDGFITDYPDRAAKFRRTLNIVPKTKK
jgi:glycerophosphoryl diester phosphodiesterase